MGMFDDLFGDTFDFNGDGETSLDEEVFGMKFLEDAADYADDSDSSDENDDYDNDDCSLFPKQSHNALSDDSDDDWRDFCEDGSEYGLDPYDFETQEEYEDALLEEQLKSNESIATDNANTVTEKFSQASLESDAKAPVTTRDSGNMLNFKNKRQYDAWCVLANITVYFNAEYGQKAKKRCKFILEKADSVIAANYLSNESGFLYSQAIKDHFTLPCSLPDEDEYREMEFKFVIEKLAKRDVSLTIKIWDWCLKEFLPYSQYDEYCANDLTYETVEIICLFSDEFKIALVKYMEEHPDFTTAVTCSVPKASYDCAIIVETAIKQKCYKTAESVFINNLNQGKNDWKSINSFIGNTITHCSNHDELETMEYFRDNLFPMVKEINLGMVQDEVEEWEKKIDDYIEHTERYAEKYAYTRRNAWRKTVPDGKPYNLNPRYYDSEKEYMDAYNSKKYHWRSWYKDEDNYGLNPNDFETYNEFIDVLHQKRREHYEKERQKKSEEQKKNRAELMSDKTIYTCCGVLFPYTDRVYTYRTDDDTIELGSKVIVPIGDDGNTKIGSVVSKGSYLRAGVPFPVDKMKFIIGKADDKKEK